MRLGQVKAEKRAADELRATIEHTRAEMHAAAKGEDFSRAHALQCQLLLLVKQLADATGAASSSSGPGDLEDVTEAQLRAKRALDEAARASAIDLTGSDDEAVPSGMSSAPSSLPKQPGSAPRSTSKKLRTSSPAAASTPSLARSPANQPAGPLPARAAKYPELPEKCGHKRGDMLEAPDNRHGGRYGVNAYGPKTAVHAGHILLRLRATNPPKMLPKQGHFSPSHLLSHDQIDAVMRGLTSGLIESEADSAKTIALLGSLQRLTTLNHGNEGLSQLVRVNWEKKLPWKFVEDKYGEARLDLWFCPKLFDIRSDYDIWLMMENMIPATPIIPRPQPPARLALAGGKASAFAFSLAGLMRAMESAGYAAAPPPPGLLVELYPFQTQSLQWMLDREKLPGGLNSLFWQEHPLADKQHRFWYNPSCGEFMSANYTLVNGRPPVSTGGFLCEEMGLGKTVEMIALILAHPYDPAVANARVECLPPARAKLLTRSHATLVVVPVSLLSQWASEVDKCVEAGRLKVALWHGDRRHSFHVTLYGVQPSREHEVLALLLEAGVDAKAAADALSKARGNPQLRHSQAFATDLVSSAPTGWTQAEAEQLVSRIEQIKGDDRWSRPVKVKLGSSLLGSDYLAGFDVVLTTYDMVLAETRNPAKRPTLTRVHWWRVVLDESQRVSNSTTVITRVCCSLPRVHSWLVSGTPVGNVVEDLLGQLLFLGVEPYCRMGADVDNFWQREVTGRFQNKDPDALEIVLELLGQVMMRHSKAQTLADAAGNQAPIVSLPPITERVVHLDLAKGSEAAVYLTIEAFVQGRITAFQSRPNPMAFYLQAYQLILGTLRACATHASLLGLDVLNAAVQRAADFDVGVQGPGDSSIHVTGDSLLSAPQPLRSVLSRLPAGAPARHKLARLLDAPASHKCASCWKPIDTLGEPVLLRCCNEVACRECATRGLDERSRASAVRCICCNRSIDVTGFIRLVPMQAAASSNSSSTSDSAAEAARLAVDKLSSPPPAAALEQLRVWVCSSAELGLLCQDGNEARRHCGVRVKGTDLRFCTQSCMKACFDACCERRGGGAAYLVSTRWPGELSGTVFGSKTEAVEALLAKLPKAEEPDPEWEGKPLYPHGATRRTDPLYPRLGKFPDGAPEGAFLAHYDVAGGGRPYGPHPGCPLGTKLLAALDVIVQLKQRGKPGGSKAVVFSESVRALSLLSDAVSAERGGDKSVALIDGSMAQERRADEIRRFTTDPACYVLFLTVGACAAGLTLTAADHCLLLEPQPNAGRELQLVNRVYRIGQTRPVTVLKFAMRNTVEERLLRAREAGAGLFAGQATLPSEADAMAVPAVPETDAAGPPTSAKMESLRELAGFHKRG